MTIALFYPFFSETIFLDLLTTLCGRYNAGKPPKTRPNHTKTKLRRLENGGKKNVGRRKLEISDLAEENTVGRVGDKLD